MLKKLSTDELKAVADPGEEDCLVWARWGGTSFEQNQHRSIGVNPYDKAFEQKLTTATAGKEEITYQQLVEMLSPNWPQESTEDDIEAYMNRMNVVVLADGWIYYRLASAGKANVPRMKYPVPAKPHLFQPSCKDILARYKGDQTYLPSEFDEEFRWGKPLSQTHLIFLVGQQTMS